MNGVTAGVSTPLILLLCAMLLLLLVLAATGYFVYRASKKAKADKRAEEGAAPPAEATAEREPVHVAGGEMARNLRQALRMVGARTRGRSSRYAQPWFLVIGPSGAGKTSLVERSALTPEVLEQVEVQGRASLTWSVLKDGVLVDVAGDWSFAPGHGTVKMWARMLRAIVRHRPARPLDGIVVALPASDFVGPEALSAADLAEDASFLHARLRQIQAETQLHLPVYVLLTRCDAVDGFASFAHGLSDDERRSMLGWANPFAAEMEFQPAWVDGALHQIRVSMDARLARLFAVEAYSREHDALFLLPNRLTDMQARLKPFLARMLHESADVPAPMFRGLFFTGSSEEDRADVGASMAGLLPVSLPQPETSYAWGSLGLHTPPNPEAAAATVALWSAGTPVEFVADLFQQKVFRERALAVPLVQRYRLRRRMDRRLQLASAVLLLVFATGMVVGYVHVSATLSRLTPPLLHVAQDFPVTAANEVAVPGVRRQEAHFATDDLLQVMMELRGAGLQAVFYPWSWGHTLERRIATALVPAVRVLVVAEFRKQLEDRARKITDPDGALSVETSQGGDALRRVEGATDPSLLTSRSMELLPAYQRQRAFAEGIVALQRHMEIYAQLRSPDSPNNVQAVAELDAYLNDRPAPAVPDDATSPILDMALQGTQPWQTQDLQLQRANAEEKERSLSHALFVAAIEQNRVQRAADAAVQALARMRTAKPAYDDIRQAQLAFNALAGALADPQLGWIGAPHFQLPPVLAEVTLEPLGKTVYLPETLRPEIEGMAQDSYETMLASLLRETSPLTGPLFRLEDGRLTLTDRAQEVQLGLDNLLNLSFMAGGGSPEYRGSALRTSSGAATLPAPSGLRSSAVGLQAYDGAIAWDKAALDAAATLPAGLQHYLSEDLAQAPPALQASLGRIAKERIGVTLEAAVAGAESQGTPLPQRPQLEAEVQPAVQAFTAVAPSLQAVMGSMRSLGLMGSFGELRGVSTRQARTLLEGLDRSFAAAALYAVPGPALDRWSGTVSPAGPFFGAATADDLTAYLTTERDRVRAYDAVAQPLLAFLQANGGATGETYRRWKGIDTALTQYDSKAPGSSLRLLETYLAGDFEKTRLSDGCGAGDRAPFPSAATDYFVGTYVSVRAELLARCALLSGLTQGSAYAKLASLFNATVAGHFPFAPPAADRLTEANPQDVANVFAFYRANAAALKLPESAGEAFVHDLARLQPFFDALDAHDAIDFVPQFRMNRTEESGGEQIAEWTLQVGSEANGAVLYRSGEPEKRGTWRVGDPVTLTLRWAKNAPFVPAAANGNNPREVTYRFGGNWALLRLFATFGVTSPSMPEGGLLEFRVPEVGVANLAKLQEKKIAEARVFARLTVFAPGKPDAVVVPAFPLPESAPVGVVQSSPVRSGKGGAR